MKGLLVIRVLLILAPFALIAGCNESTAPHEPYSAQVMRRFEYSKDKYGICYASFQTGANAGLLTTVPCEKVGL